MMRGTGGTPASAASQPGRVSIIFRALGCNEAERKTMNTGSYIAGKWFHPNSTRVTRNVNPADPSDVIAEFPSATAADAVRAVEAAKAAATAWRATPAPERGR